MVVPLAGTDEVWAAGGRRGGGPHGRQAPLSGGVRRAAPVIDPCLTGAKPAELPVEQPITCDVGIHLTTAQALGLTVPPTLLCQADEVLR